MCLDIINHINLINNTAVTYRHNQHCNVFQRGLQESKLPLNAVSCRHFYMIGTFKGFGSNATIKLSSSLIPRNQISLSQFSWWARKQKALSSHVKARHLLSLSAPVLAPHAQSGSHSPSMSSAQAPLQSHAPSTHQNLCRNAESGKVSSKGFQKWSLRKRKSKEVSDT